ncbi:hypothetical protein PVAND_003036 [Polypedilum vanderplanki]|uniref:Armadillo repeat-containing protein 3 n=1 Tax=Polypedilum vanderplanki TaxID=319348 RepID=A0A9J6BTQ1_POLVA|nr:hypothetical protein PVAND_003036 [Polypedilum vanderplanki]
MTISKKVEMKPDTKNIYISKQSYIDRNAKSLDFPDFTIRIEKISTILLLLQSPEEDEVVEKALYHIDKFASMGKQQLYALEENRIYEFALKLIKSENMIVKKFTFKLLVQLIHNIEDCRKKLLKDVDLIEESKNIFMKSTDENLVEFSCILLHYVCSDLRHIHAMTEDGEFVAAIFTRINSSSDPDILLQSIRLLNLIMNNSMLITSILNMNEFPLKSLQIELKNDCREIQVAALESIQIISSLCEHPFKDDFTSDSVIEIFHEICMDKDVELQKLALKILKNICKDEQAVIKVSQYLLKYLQLFINGMMIENQEELLQILTSLASFEDNLRIMHENGFISEIFKMVKENASVAACDALIVMSKKVNCLEDILKENVYSILLQLLNDTNVDKILTTFQSLINLQGLNYLLDITSNLVEVFIKILKTSPSAPLKVKVIGILEKLAIYSSLKTKISQYSELSKEIFFCLLYSSYSTKLIVRLFHLIAIYIDQESFRKSFIEFNASEIIEIYLSSQVTQVRASVCTLINLASNYAELPAHLIDNGVLKALQQCDFECSICYDSFESLLNTNISVKFSVLRRLESNEKISSGFYASKSNKLDWQVQRELMKTDLHCPVLPIYTINFDDKNYFGDECRKIPIDKNLTEIKNLLNENEEFKNANYEQKVQILATKVSKFFKADECCMKDHLNELKSELESSIIPLGSLIYANSFEAALMFKALADQFNIEVSFITDDINGKSWNELKENCGIIDLFFDIGEIYDINSQSGRMYLKNIS